MPLLVVKKLKVQPPDIQYIEIEQITQDYPGLASGSEAVLGILRRVFDQEGKRIIQHPNALQLFPIVRLNRDGYGMTLTGATFPIGVPLGSYCEVLVTNVKLGQAYVPAYPGEMRKDTDWNSNVNSRVDAEIGALERIGVAHETIGRLYAQGLHLEGSDLQVGLVKMNQDDYDGAIQSFRKVAEGLRNALKQGRIQIRNSEGKTEATRAFLQATFNLLSASGLHTNTVGLREEAILAQEIAVASAQFVASTGGSPKQAREGAA